MIVGSCDTQEREDSIVEAVILERLFVLACDLQLDELADDVTAAHCRGWEHEWEPALVVEAIDTLAEAIFG